MTDSCSGFPGRTKLPYKMAPKDDLNLWKLLKNNVGKELSKISMPVEMNEPLSFLQRLSENLEYYDLILKADASHDAVRRLEYITAFVISSVSSSYRRLAKPFNPLLGETYELNRCPKEGPGFHIVCEQVSHHPPVSAFHVDGGDIFKIYGSVSPRTSFSGKNLEITLKGLLTLELPRHREVYTWRSVPAYMQNLFVGQPTMENIGTQEIVCHGGKYHCEVTWKASSTFTSRDPHRVEGRICLNNSGQVVRVIKGRWFERVISHSPKGRDGADHSRKNGTDSLFNGALHRFSFSQFGFDGSRSQEENKHASGKPKIKSTRTTSMSHHNTHQHPTGISTVSGESLPISGSSSRRSSTGQDARENSDEPFLLWEVRPRPPGYEEYYNFTYLAMTLNEFPATMDDAKFYPPTDSRFRGDIRLLEEGKIAAAADEKHRLEESQREREKNRMKSADSDYKPKWFIKSPHVTAGTPTWHFNKSYLQRDWRQCELIFQ